MGPVTFLKFGPDPGAGPCTVAGKIREGLLDIFFNLFYGFLLFLRFFSIELIKIRTMNMIDNRNFRERGNLNY